MRGAARLHANKARRQLGEERQHLAASQRLADDNLAPLIDRVNLKNALGQVEADRANTHRGWLLARGRFDSFHTLALRCREREPSTPSAFDPNLPSEFDPKQCCA